MNEINALHIGLYDTVGQLWKVGQLRLRYLTKLQDKKKLNKTEYNKYKAKNKNTEDIIYNRK